MNRNVWWMIPFLVILSAILISGCPKSKQAVAPGSEEKKETSESVSAPQKTDQESTASKPPSTPSRPAPVTSAAPAQPKGPQAVEKTPPQASEPSQDSIASGETLLNTAVPQDAEKIQTRLADLGLYKGPIDGIWGKGSRAGLKAFKEQNSLANPDKWDRETQIALFREAGQAAQPVAQPGADAGKESISSGSVLLDPSSPQDARKIQTRLLELGLYKGQIDGIWGKGSQAALKAFKEQNSLANPDKWDKETQMLLFR